MRERALTFGPANLVGILTQPDPEVAIPGAPACVILNSGILHRAGASRIYVKIARALATEGMATLRFDFSGVGDSEVRRGEAIPIEERFIQETREAIDYLQESLGVDHFVVGGLCSGADGAFWTGLEDERVVGIWQIDAFCYPTPKYYARRYLPKLLDPRAWIHSIKVRMAPKETRAAEAEEVFVKPEYRRIFPERHVVGDGLRRLRERDVLMYFLFSGDQEYLYERQHRDAFPESMDTAQVRFIPDCSHTMTTLEHQDRLIEDLRAWVRPLCERHATPAGAVAGD
jgi:hypothetical protein